VWRWRIYYGDGSTYGGASAEEAFNAPAVNVQVIYVRWEGEGKQEGLVTSKDTYLWREGRWWGSNEAGMYDYLMLEPGPLKVLFGRTIHDDAYREAKRRASKEGVGV
jgi:hypothetical protein